MADALAVVDAADADRAVVLGSNIGGHTAIRFAAEHADRTDALVLVNASARYVRDDDYPIGYEADEFGEIAQRTTAVESEGFDFLTTFAPTVANDAKFREWWDRVGHRGASPTRSRQLWQLLMTADAVPYLSQVRAPTLVISRPGVVGESGQFIANRVTGAKHVELPGPDLMWWVGDADAVADEIESFLAATVGIAAHSRRALATVLFLDIAASTDQLAAMGDRRWTEVLDTYYGLVERHIDRLGGRRVSTEGDGVLTTFPSPGDAVRCALAVAGAVEPLGIRMRAGLHAGEVELLGDDVAGMAVHIASRVLAAAGAGEVLVSRTVCDLLLGSGMRFETRGSHELKGVGTWELFAVQP